VISAPTVRDPEGVNIHLSSTECYQRFEKGVDDAVLHPKLVPGGPCSAFKTDGILCIDYTAGALSSRVGAQKASSSCLSFPHLVSVQGRIHPL
jgi:hypothetical protein